ncbi:MAG: hypothetical protein ACOC1P_00380 [Minisyncoccales bacterium]
MEQKGFIRQEGYDKETLEKILDLLREEYTQITDFQTRYNQATINAYLNLKNIYKKQFGTHYEEQIETERYTRT